ncbi:alpha/beta fold hydrolase [Nocardioides acrostichi]|uniref:Alpha/beta fold hydrolase n=1 Tax=Nocardioides acrostichi TaxID=2784339 RepID=A0A930YEA6_9ACTN|nr:alpha/beta hydrolase [Nocardioides acrostichi]MBF4163314.1 alpha/beta fold hydrolase [Nocardioides acrostichi]
MTWTLEKTAQLPDGEVRWTSIGAGAPVVLVHGTPYSSYLWRDVAPALAAQGREVYVFDHLGYGQSDKREGQDLTLAAQGRRFAALLRTWGLERPSVVACDIGGAIVLRALLLEGARYADLTLFDAVTGGAWEHGLFAQIREHHEVFAQLPAYAHRALVEAHLGNGTHAGYRPGALEVYLEPWLGSEGQEAFYRQYRQLDPAHTAEYEPLLGTIDIPVTLLWGREDRILPPRHGEWLQQRVPHRGLTWVEGSGHLMSEDAPAQLAAALIASTSHHTVA